MMKIFGKLMMGVAIFTTLSMVGFNVTSHADTTSTMTPTTNSVNVSQPNSVVSRADTRIEDGVYHPFWQSYDGRFNVGFEIVVANNEIISATNPWYDLVGMTVLFDRLSLLSPKEAVYYLQVVEGHRVVNQYLHAKINMAGTLQVYLTYD